MALFGSRTTKPAFGADIKAAAGAAQQATINATYTYTVGTQELRALQLPTVSRARDLIASMVGCLDLRSYRLAWDPQEEEYEKIYVEGESWFTRPDPAVTRNFIMANTFSDLLFYGRAFWLITGRYSTGFPASFKWLPAANITTLDQAGPAWFQPSDQVQFNGVDVDSRNLVQFLAPIMGIVYSGAAAIDTAWKLDNAARRLRPMRLRPATCSSAAANPCPPKISASSQPHGPQHGNATQSAPSTNSSNGTNSTLILPNSSW
jgi:hypothetical protein